MLLNMPKAFYEGLEAQTKNDVMVTLNVTTMVDIISRLVCLEMTQGLDTCLTALVKVLLSAHTNIGALLMHTNKHYSPL